MFGAAIGCLMAANKIGNKALVFGGICALLPSLDWFLSLFFSTTTALYIFGGITHSIIFCLLLSPIIGWLLNKYVARNMTVVQWTIFVFCSMMSHCAFEVLKIHGVGILEPFVHKRLALSILPDIEYFSCIPLLLAFILSYCLHDLRHKRLISWFGLFLFVVFAFFTFLNKLSNQAEFEHELDEQRVRYSRVEVFPVQGSLFLWNCIAQDRDGFWMCYKSNLSNNNFEYSLALRNDYYLFELEENPQVKRLTAYTRYFYIIEPDYSESAVYLHDLRYAKKGLRTSTPFSSTYKIKYDEKRFVTIEKK